MRRWVAKLAVATGWVVLILAVVTPLVGVAWALAGHKVIQTDVIAFPRWWRLLTKSVVLATLAAFGSLIFAVGPAWWLATCRRTTRPLWLGLILAPLLLPPHVYAYAWSLTHLASNMGTEWLSVIWAGLISAAWLWPIPALILASAWRTMGSEVMALAILDTSPGQAFWRAVLPTLRHAMVGGCCAVFIVAMLDYPIPQLMVADVYPIELLTLVNVNAPYGQIIRSAMPEMAVVAAAVVVAWWHLRVTRDWGRMSDETRVDMVLRRNRAGLWGVWGLRILAVAVWIATVGVPLRVMLHVFRRPGVWKEAFTTFTQEWWVSLAVALAAGLLACSILVATVIVERASVYSFDRWLARVGAAGAALTGLLPPVVLGVGFVVVYNGLEVLRPYYTQTCCVWALALASRFAAIALVIGFLAWGRHADEEIDQARADGADLWSVLGDVLLPRIRGPFVAAGLMVALLAMFEVVITQFVGPIRYQSIAVTLLNHMHYGRDDVVITMCLVIMGAGVLLTQVCAWLLGAQERD